MLLNLLRFWDVTNSAKQKKTPNSQVSLPKQSSQVSAAAMGITEELLPAIAF